MLSGQSSMSCIRKPNRPSIALDATDGDWALFIDEWTRYKDMCGLKDLAVMRNELRSACTPETNRLLFELIGPEALNTATEEHLLQQIRLVAVKGLHTEVHRQNFHSMWQKEGESITHFLAWLRAQAKFCKFTVTCPNEMNCGHQVNYSGDRQMIAGLVNMEHQNRVLAEAATLTTLEQKFQRLVSLETTDMSTPYLCKMMHPLALFNVQRSDHKQWSSETKTTSTPRYAEHCSRCGKISHPGGSMDCKSCAAVRLVCHYCGVKGHIKKVCRKRMTSRMDTMSKAFMFANKNHAVRKHNRTQWRAMPHLAWNGEQFERSPPDPPPLATVEVAMMPKTLAKFGCVPMGSVSRRSHKIIAFADTGAQTCSSGPEIQELLGYMSISCRLPTEYVA